MSKPRTTARSDKPAADATIDLTYALADLPSSQHRAGLAGLVLTVRALERRRPRPPGSFTLLDLGPSGVTLRLDAVGLATLFDAIYHAERVAREYDKPFTNTPPDDERQIEETDAKGKTKLRTRYIYNLVRPDGACQRTWDPHDSPAHEGPWIKLWRDMVWNILRGVPATRTAYEARADGKPTDDAAAVWDNLLRRDATVKLPSTYFLGAQAVTAENVEFTDLARNQLLLHFWPFAVPIFVPQLTTIEPDGTANNDFSGFVLAVPDIGDLAVYCDVLPDMMLARSDDRTAFRPREAVVDITAESALRTLISLHEQLRVRQARADTVEVIHGIDAFHVEKEGNNIRIRHVVRVAPAGSLLDEYKLIRESLWSPVFRRQLLGNRLAGRAWHTGFDRLLSITPWKHVLGDGLFTHDARNAPNLFPDAPMTTDATPTAEPTTAEIVYGMVLSYLLQKLKTKYGLDWKQVKDDPRQRGEYNERKFSLAREAFLAARSRTGADFIEYFTATLCSVPQFIPEARFVHVAHKLHDKTGCDEIRTLTLLALSAHGYAPKSKEAAQETA